MVKRCKTVLLVLVLILLPSIKSHAETMQMSFCFGNDVAYAVTYDESKNTEVKYENITLEAVKEGHLPYPDDLEDERYQFTAVRIAGKCYMKDNQIHICPNDSSAFDNLKKAYIGDSSETDDGEDNSARANSKNVTIKFNRDTGKFDITLVDAKAATDKKGKKVKVSKNYKIRYVGNKEAYNYYNDATLYAGQFLKVDSKGKYHIYGVDPNQAVGLEFYQTTNDECKDSFIGRILFYTPSEDQIAVENPAVDNPSKYGCNQVKNFKVENLKDSSVTLSDLKKMVVPLCYNKTITYEQYKNLANYINAGYKSLHDLFYDENNNLKFEITKQKSTSDGCTDTYDGATSLAYSTSGAYWSMSCVEGFSSSGDTPKLVQAGAGFNYSTTYEVTRTCTLTQHTFPQYRPQCVQHCSCDCTWYYSDGSLGSSGGHDAGPNDQFDLCVKECDGGKYTQSCINSCYSKTYSKQRDFSFSSNFSLDTRKDSNIAFTFTGDMTAEEAAAAGLVVAVEGPDIKTSVGRPAIRYTRDGVDKESCTCNVSKDYCALGHGDCTYHFWVGPSNCVDDPASVYKQEVDAANNEHSAYLAIANDSPIAVGDYSMTITDTYITNSNGDKFKFTLDSNSDPALLVKSSQHSTGSGRKATIKVNLPLSYVNKITGDATYRSNDNAKNAWIINANGKSIVNGFDKAYYYFTPDERKYYTNVNSPNFNVKFVNDLPELDTGHHTFNINVKATNVGWSKFSVDNKCYYGVYNNYHHYDIDHCDSETEVCDDGIQYIFRPIVLSDVFPNGRDPRYNWSAAAIGKGTSLYTTLTSAAVVDPITYTEKVQTKGDTIYNSSSGEVDYEFKLNPQSIAAIKKYNREITDINKDGDKNYLDYDLSCYYVGTQKICTSKFLDNTDIITYANGHSVQDRHDIAGCNNATGNGTTCDVKAHGK